MIKKEYSSSIKVKCSLSLQDQILTQTTNDKLRYRDCLTSYMEVGTFTVRVGTLSSIRIFVTNKHKTSK